MQLHEIKRNKPNKKKKRIGRGGKKGTYSGKGMKGQKSRAGGTPRPVLRDIVKKFPKRRGYRFNSIQVKPVTLSLETIDKHFIKDEIVSPVTLRKKNLIGKSDRKVKILGDGDIEFGLTFEGYITFSDSAKKKIEKAGGKIDTKAKFRSTLPKAERPKKIKKSKAAPKKEIKIEKTAKKSVAKKEMKVLRQVQDKPEKEKKTITKTEKK